MEGSAARSLEVQLTGYPGMRMPHNRAAAQPASNTW